MTVRETSILFLALYICIFLGEAEAQVDQTVTLSVDGSQCIRRLPHTLFGLFFEEINHAGDGGLWAELVQNRGFEAGGQNTPSNIAPWYPVGNDEQIWLGTERSSLFDRNPVALHVEVLCESDGDNKCPDGGVGVSNPGFWGMDIREGKTYRVEFWLQSADSQNISIAFTSADREQVLAQKYLRVDAGNAEKWLKQEFVLEAKATDHNARLELTSGDKGVFWLDQISAMPTDTFKGHGFRKELALMLEDLKPGFLRFPGGCYVEGDRLPNAWRWRDSVGPFEERPGHYGDVWNYWSDDGFGYYEGLQLAEDLGALPVWVFNMGISHTDSVSPALLQPFIADTLDGIQFARGPTSSIWGAVRAQMGHPEPFELRYVAIGNEDCWKPNYRSNYLKFYTAIKASYPDIGIISNCDGSYSPLDHPADFYDFHIYTSANNLFAMSNQFDYTSRAGPKVFVSEYAVTGWDSGKGSLLAALAEGAFCIGIELNSDVVEMASYAPLFVNDNDRRWNPDAIVFNSWQQYGTPSYWVQQVFKHSNGAYLLPFAVEASSVLTTSVLRTSALFQRSQSNGSGTLIIKAVNYGMDLLRLHLLVVGLTSDIEVSQATMTILTSPGLMDENSFANPEMVAPKKSQLANPGKEMQIILPPYSIVALELGLVSLHAGF